MKARIGRRSRLVVFVCGFCQQVSGWKKIGKSSGRFNKLVFSYATCSSCSPKARRPTSNGYPTLDADASSLE